MSALWSTWTFDDIVQVYAITEECEHFKDGARIAKEEKCAI